jgi:PPM family protein phosphatase
MKASPQRVPVKIEAAGDTHIGGRTHNEDAILLRPDLNLYIVADGAGGQNAGNVAAHLATTTIAHFFEQTKGAADALPEYDGLGLPTAARRLSAAVQEANKEILEIAKTSDRHRGMGTTVVAALFIAEHRSVHVAYVGDSRCYRLREGRLELLSHDHSLINDVLELRPNISDERVRRLPQNVITRALGMMDNLRVSVRSHALVHGDRYLLCSDGLSDHVSDGQIAESLALDIPCDEQVALLVSMALDAGAGDNVACVIIDCALPHHVGKAATRPMKTSSKRVSRPMPRVDAVTEESVPEIVLYDRPEQRDSSPLIHVVPTESSSPEVVEAVQGVIDPGAARAPGAASRAATNDHDDDPITKEYGTPAPTGSMPDPAPPDSEPPLPGRITPKLPTPRSPAGAPVRKLQTPIAGIPAMAPHNDSARSDSTERGGAAATAYSKVTAPRLRKPEGKPEEDAEPRSGDTQQPPGTAPPKETLPPKAPPTPSEPDLALPPIASIPASALPRPKRTPPVLPDGLRTTMQGTGGELPGTAGTPRTPDFAGTPRTPPGRIGKPIPKVAVPPARGPLDTSDFTNDSIPCHACGSVIMRTAAQCMYCGAPTGFVIKEPTEADKKTE